MTCGHQHHTTPMIILLQKPQILTRNILESMDGKL